uniref:cytochrome c oxidase subunit 6b-1-like n=1 Tax=Erigeron canadensis TaxID=72917 RepID=UPI001CB90DE5|nr:cytochrome c oxidase subunit 6b-1-like [Erigeron canadensis]
MAESDKSKSLSEDYLLKDTVEKVAATAEPVEKSPEKDAVDDAPEPSVTEDSVESSAASAVTESVAASVDAAAEETVAATDSSDTDATEPAPAASEESGETAEEENTADETPEIKLETAPGDYRFPTTNQSRHCFTRYVEYHRCVAAKGEGASECDKFAKYYRSLCPGEWVDRWNEQRENGTFPGPL